MVKNTIFLIEPCRTCIEAKFMEETLTGSLSRGFALIDELKLNEALLFADELLVKHQRGAGKGYALALRGEVLLYSGHYAFAAACFFESIKIGEETQDDTLKAEGFCGLSYVYRFMEDYITAIDYAQRSRQLLGERKNNVFLKSLLSEGISHARSGNIEKSDLFLNQARVLAEKSGDDSLLITSEKSIADLYLGKKEFVRAIKLYETALIHCDKKQHYVLKTMILVRMAEALEQDGKPEVALKVCKQALAEAEGHDFVAGQKSAHFFLSTLLEKKGEKDRAFNHLKLFFQLQNSDNPRRQTQAISKMELAFVKESLDKETRLMEQLREKHQALTSSLDYAKGLQEAILPLNESQQDPTLDYFVFFKPKEKVGGDFYRIEQHDARYVFCVADCTGHGVPGGMLSLLCSELVNQAMRSSLKSGLNSVMQNVNLSLHDIFGNKKNLITANDGMDISFAVIEKNKANGESVLRFCGANQCAILIRNQEVIQTAYNRGGISLLTPVDYNFIETTYPLQTGDRLFLFTDGYADQFGGNDPEIRQAGGKKFKHRKLIELFQKAAKTNVSAQKELFGETLEHWMGELEQIDDICVLGIHLKS
jgi:serine phosphatase RsbU (regulator of sigma subunit)